MRREREQQKGWERAESGGGRRFDDWTGGETREAKEKAASRKRHRRRQSNRQRCERRSPGNEAVAAADLVRACPHRPDIRASACAPTRAWFKRASSPKSIRPPPSSLETATSSVDWSTTAMSRQHERPICLVIRRLARPIDLVRLADSQRDTSSDNCGVAMSNVIR